MSLYCFVQPRGINGRLNTCGKFEFRLQMEPGIIQSCFSHNQQNVEKKNEAFGCSLCSGAYLGERFEIFKKNLILVFLIAIKILVIFFEWNNRSVFKLKLSLLHRLKKMHHQPKSWTSWSWGWYLFPFYTCRLDGHTTYRKDDTESQNIKWHGQVTGDSVWRKRKEKNGDKLIWKEKRAIYLNRSDNSVCSTAVWYTWKLELPATYSSKIDMRPTINNEVVSIFYILVSLFPPGGLIPCFDSYWIFFKQQKNTAHSLYINIIYPFFFKAVFS